MVSTLGPQLVTAYDAHVDLSVPFVRFVLAVSQAKTYIHEARSVRNALDGFEPDSDQLSKHCPRGTKVWVVTAAHEFSKGELRVQNQASIAADIQAQTSHGGLQVQGGNNASSQVQIKFDRANTGRKWWRLGAARSRFPLALHVQPLDKHWQFKRSTGRLRTWFACGGQTS